MDRRSERNLIGVNDDLTMIVQRAYALFSDEVTRLPGSKLVIIDGVRTEEEQAINVAAGRSWTMESKHLTGDAIDFAVIAGGEAIWELPVYERVWIACFRPAANCLGTTINWGGHWRTKDGPHIELAE